MPEITKQIQNLIEQGETEKALQSLADWLRTQQTSALNEVILLRSRYEQVERELGMNLISPEEGARAYSQINFALLNLLQNLEKPMVSNAAPATNRRGWLIAGAGALLLLVLIMFVLKILFPSRALSDNNNASETEQQTQNREDETATRANGGNKIANIQLPGGKEASLVYSGQKVTYTVLEASAESYNPENQKVTVKIRCLLGEGRFGMNFWSSSFRLIANDLPYAAQGELNELVENESFKDGEVYFLIPTNARAADLQLRFGDQTTVLPMQW